MDQHYYVSLVKINYSKSQQGTTKAPAVEGFSLHAVEKLSDTLVPIGFLMDANFKIFVNNKELKISDDWILINKGKDGNYELIFNSPKVFNKEDYIIISVNRNAAISNKLFIDLDAVTNNLGEYKIENYKITTPGTYYFVIDSVDGMKVNKRSKYAYTFVAEEN